MSDGKIRESNFELLRIISMIMVVFLHYMGKGGALENTKPFEANYIISHLIESLSIVAVNCYIMISGYFLIKSDFKMKKLITLWLQVLFYSIGIYLFLLVIGVEQFSIKMLIKVSFPIILKEYWFMSGYMALLVLSPFINIAIKNFNKRQLKLLILVLVVLFVLWGKNNVSIGYLFVNSGYSVTHFIFLYILAAYVRLYWEVKINKYIYLLGYLICTLAIGFVGIFLHKAGRLELWTSYILDYSSVGVVLASFCLFMFIREIKIKSALINRIAPLTLSVYLIHEHLSVKKFIYTDILHTTAYVHSEWFVLHAVASILSIFIICIFIDVIRKTLFDNMWLWIEKKFVSSYKNQFKYIL